MNAQTGVTIVGDIIEILTSALVPLGEKIGEGLSTMVKSAFCEVAATGENAGQVTGLNPLGIVVVCFAAISLAVGLTKFITKYVMSLGARK